MDTSEFEGKRLSLVDDNLAENLYFRGNQVTATIGVKGGPLCVPILCLASTGKNSLEMRTSGITIGWEEIAVKDD